MPSTDYLSELTLPNNHVYVLKDKNAVTNVSYNSSTRKLTQTINGTSSDILTVDSTPTDGSENPITSNAVYDGLSGKADKSSTVFDVYYDTDICQLVKTVGSVDYVIFQAADSVSSSVNPITAKGVKDALELYAKADMSNAAAATTSTPGVVQLSSAFNDDSQTKAATPYTIKMISGVIESVVNAGAKNNMPFDIDAMKAGNASAGYTWSGNVCTISDGASLNITVTVNDDNTIVATGSKPATSSGLNFRIVPAANAFNLPLSTYVLSGCPSGGSSNTYQIRALINNSSVFAQDIGESVEFTTTAKPIERVEIVFGRNAMSNFNLTFKPMICLKDYWIISHTFTPFVPSNYQLYELIKSYHP